MSPKHATCTRNCHNSLMTVNELVLKVCKPTNTPPIPRSVMQESTQSSQGQLFLSLSRIKQRQVHESDEPSSDDHVEQGWTVPAQTNTNDSNEQSK